MLTFAGCKPDRTYGLVAAKSSSSYVITVWIQAGQAVTQAFLQASKQANTNDKEIKEKK